ncbi:hypothetical protein IJG98_00985 [Candidatus Saccharibacteria bacterium]|nr:hypothetical protein [Candidatus Saccharibacteria bacterium]
MSLLDTLADICLLIIFSVCYVLILPFYLVECLINRITGRDELTEKDRYYQRYL